MVDKHQKGYYKARRILLNKDLKYVLKQAVYQAKLRSIAKGFKFDIDNEYVIGLAEEQYWRCCISGREFDSSKTEFRTNPNTPSLDRIVPNLGYIKGNVRVVTWQVNCAMSEYGLDTFLELCKDVDTFNK